jgi:hypothetical protein
LVNAGGVVLLSLAIAGCGEGAPGTAGSSAQSAAPPAPTSVAEEALSSAPSAADVAAGARATVVSNAAQARERASAATLTVYRAKAGVALQDYANAMGTLRETDRQIGVRPALISDAEWLDRTRKSLRLMQSAADRLIAIDPIPPEMAVTDGLIRQIDGDTRVLNQEYGLGIENVAPAAVTTAGARTTPLLALLAQANRELRRGAQ